MTQHRVIAYRSDCSSGADAIHFSGEQWRDYVPIRLPWALCIRERVPAGSVAVLLNPAHQHRDLMLPINAAQDRLLGQIDGQRRLGDIVAAFGSSEGARSALAFFQQLWWYDQIVFDASGAVAVE